jgi:hypothetical protein
VTPAELPPSVETLRKVKKKKKKCYTALTRLRRNEPLARERVQQGRTRGCHQPHFKRLERCGKCLSKKKKKKQLHRAHATTSQRTAGYRKVATD